MILAYFNNFILVFFVGMESHTEDPDDDSFVTYGEAFSDEDDGL